MDPELRLEFAGLIRATWRLYSMTPLGASILADHEMARDSADRVYETLIEIGDLGNDRIVLDVKRVDVREILTLCKLIDIDRSRIEISVRGRIIREALSVQGSIELAFPMMVSSNLEGMTRDAADVLAEMRLV